MPVNRFYHPAPLKDIIVLAGAELKHLSQVIRAGEGEVVELFDGKGTLATATILSLTKREGSLQINETTYTPAPPPLILAQALTRINKLDLIVEKCTELGVTAFHLFPGERSERKELSDHQLERLHHLIIAACKQSGRVWLPQISVQKVISKWEKPSGIAIFGDPTATRLLRDFEPRDVTVICNGPESGLSDTEERLLSALGYKPCRWNEATLRSETAAIAAVALLRSS